jgi:hypothetical protein
MPRVAGTMKDISEFSAKEKHRRAKIPQGFKAPTRSNKVSAFTAYVLAVSAELNGIEKVSAAKEEAQAAKAVAAAREAAVEARLEKDGRTVIKCMVAEGEEPSTFWAGVQTQDNDKGDKRCLCSTCSRAQRDELIAQADVAPQDEPVPSSSALPSDPHASKMKAFSTVAPDPDEVRAFAARRSRRRTASATSGGGDAINLDEYGVVDSGANRHLMGRHVRLMNPRFKALWMKSANGESNYMDLAGDFEINCEDEHGNKLDPLVLRDASQMKGSPFNLLSMSLLCERGLQFHFEQGNSHFIYQGTRYPLIEKNGLYLIKLNEVLKPEEVDLMATVGGAGEREVMDVDDVKMLVAATYQLWHDRFGHANTKRIKFLYNNGSVEGLDVNGRFQHKKDCACETCRMVNNAKRHVPRHRQHADQVCRPGQLVYSDLVGPFPRSIEGYRYAISFTDVFSRYSCCYMLKSKSDASGALRAAAAYFERHNVKIDELRSDQGGEFSGHHEQDQSVGSAGKIDGKKKKSLVRRKDGTTVKGQTPNEDGMAYGEDFRRVCNELKITHVLCPAHRPEIHGLAERWNRTVTKMANSMLYASRLSYLLWPEAICHANMLRNRLPVRGLGPMTPYEIFIGKRPRVDDLRVWGCDAYRLEPTYPKVPGQSARRRLIYVGETADRIGFRCFDPETFTFTTEFELTFDEQSGRKRLNALREHDLRRELQRRGKLEELPLIQNDYGPETNELKQMASDINRQLYAPLRTTEETVQNGGGTHGNVSGTASSRHRQSDTPSGSSGLPTQLATEEEQNGGSDSTRTSGDLAKQDNHSRRRLMGAFDEEHNEGSQPSSTSTPLPQPSQSDDAPGSAAQQTDSFRRGRHPRAPASLGRPLHLHLTDQDEGDITLNDLEADRYGPLTEEQLKRERKLSTFDPSRPRRPVRVLPIGKAEEDTEAFQRFRSVALENDYPIKFIEENPKFKGSASYKRYDRYCQARTLNEVIELSMHGKTAKERREQRGRAMKDIVNDALRGYILFPEHEHASLTHYVNAAEVARECGTLNFMALYSE